MCGRAYVCLLRLIQKMNETSDTIMVQLVGLFGCLKNKSDHQQIHCACVFVCVCGVCVCMYMHTCLYVFAWGGGGGGGVCVYVCAYSE